MLGERVPLTVVAAQLGHADPAITARIYAHLVDDRDLDLAAGAFERRSATETVGETVGRFPPRTKPHG
jgi:integrase